MRPSEAGQREYSLPRGVHIRVQEGLLALEAFITDAAVAAVGPSVVECPVAVNEGKSNITGGRLPR